MNTARKDSIHEQTFWVIAIIAWLCVLWLILTTGQSASQYEIKPKAEQPAAAQK
jgi:hypothetical protein